MRFASFCLLLVIVCMCAVSVIYPWLHETGHLLGALLMKCEVIHYSLFPPFCVFNMRSFNHISLLAVSFGGVVFPFLILFFVPDKYFYIWVVKIVLTIMNISYIVCSLGSILLMRAGVNVTTDDIVAVLMIYPELKNVCVALLSAMGCLMIIMLTKQHISERIYIRMQAIRPKILYE